MGAQVPVGGGDREAEVLLGCGGIYWQVKGPPRDP